MVRCPKKMQAGMARDACMKEQAKHGLGCGLNCAKGVVVLRASADYLELENSSEATREVVRERHRKWDNYKPTGRPRGRPRAVRAPSPGGVGSRSAAR